MSFINTKEINKFMRRPSYYLRKDLHESEREKELQLKLMQRQFRYRVLNSSRAIFTRVVFIIEISLFIYYLVGFYSSYFYLFILIGALIIVIDGFYVVLNRDGNEYSW